LCEKPLSRNVDEALQILQSARNSGTLLKTGFNYRHLPHVRKAKELIDSGAIGRLMFMRCHFGHGGRPGFDHEWHTDPKLSGGGVLQEQGIHLMDLIRHLLGDPARVLAHRDVFYWSLSEIEDNCFCLFETKQNQIAQIHVSWTQWRNTFQMEIFGTDGYIKLKGRDGSYGSPEITWAKRNADHSRPHEEILEFEQGEDWRLEWMEFLSAICEKRQPAGNGQDGLYAQLMIEKAYQSASDAKWLDFEPAWSACSQV
jgi:predicted dehydrogenase